MGDLPYDTTIDAYGDVPSEPRPEQDPDNARDQLLDDVRDGLRDPPPYLRAAERRRVQEARQREVDLAEKHGRLMPHGDAYVAGTWPYDPF